MMNYLVVTVVVIVCTILLIIHHRTAVVSNAVQLWYTDPFIPGTCDYTLSFAMIPPRWWLLPQIINQVNQVPIEQRPREIRVTISTKYERFGQWDDLTAITTNAERYNVYILVRPDVGPVVKLSGATVGPLATLIVDDDRVISPFLFASACGASKSTHVTSFSVSSDRILYGSYGYMFPANSNALASQLIHNYNKTYWGYNDDVYITCKLMELKMKIHTIPISTSSFWTSEITSSRSVGLINTKHKYQDESVPAQLCPYLELK